MKDVQQCSKLKHQQEKQDYFINQILVLKQYQKNENTYVKLP